MKKHRKNPPRKESGCEKKPDNGFLIRNDRAILASIVAVITFLVYCSSLNNDFISNWDDNRYILDNVHIRSIGLNFFKWAFTDYITNLWHPVTWISLALDYALWGLHPFGYHLANVVFHSINTGIVVMLSWLLLRAAAGPRNDIEEPQGLTERHELLIASGITALLFGIHPLHVESVAWVTERKDLLYSLFYMLSIISYIHYVSNNRSAPTSFLTNRRYLLSLGCFALSLGSKPMAITLPLICLLLDWYPLRRLKAEKLTFLLAEKIPFMALSLFVSLLAIMAQKEMGAMKSLTEASLPFRIVLACKSLVLYLTKIIIPVRLLPLYPYPKLAIPYKPEYLIALLAVLALTALCVVHRKRWPHVSVVWFFFVISLLPVLGITQAGVQSMADRYVYLPILGPLLLAAVGATLLWRKAFASAIARQAFIGTAVVAAFLLISLTVRQVGIWKNAVTLWNYMIEKRPGDYEELYLRRGQAYHAAGLPDAAIEDFSRYIAHDPTQIEAYLDRGMVFLGKKLYDRANADFDKAISLNPADDVAYTIRGSSYAQQGYLSKAREDFTRAIAIKPLYPAYYNRGLVLMDEGDFSKAVEDFTAAINLQSDVPQLHFVRGDAYMKTGRMDLAAQDYSKACSMGVQVACGKAVSSFQPAK